VSQRVSTDDFSDVNSSIDLARESHLCTRSRSVSSQLQTDSTLNAARVRDELNALGAEIFYEKTLTSSDANGSGRIVIPKAVAEVHFPILENQAGISIDAIDSIGNTYGLKFRYALYFISKQAAPASVSQVLDQ